MSGKRGLRININQNIRIARREDEEEWHASSVQDIDGREISIAVPTRGAVPLVLNTGDSVKVTYLAEDSKFEFETTVTGRRHDNIPLYVLAMPSEYKRIQLREFVRVFAVLEVYYAEVPEDGREPVYIKGYSFDLSGGGIRLLLKEKYEADTNLLINFAIQLKTGPEHLKVQGRVVRSWLDENSGLYQTAVQFININRREQDLIVRYVLMKMSEQRRLR